MALYGKFIPGCAHPMALPMTHSTRLVALPRARTAQGALEAMIAPDVACTNPRGKSDTHANNSAKCLLATQSPPRRYAG